MRITVPLADKLFWAGASSSPSPTPPRPGTTYTGAKYLGVNLWYIPVRNVSIGLEYLYGQRKNLNGQRGEANRLQLLFQYNS